MIEVRRTKDFDSWFRVLSDRMAKAKIAARIDRLALGNPGDVSPVGSGITEMRIHHGAGYRVYYIGRGDMIVLLLCGGDKKSQPRDIARAKALAGQLRD